MGINRVCKAWKHGIETEVFTDSAAVEKGAKSARTVRVRAIGCRFADRCEQCSEVRRFVIDNVVDAMCRCRHIEHASNSLRNVDMVANRHALPRWKAAHIRDSLRKVWIAVAVDEWQTKHTYVEIVDREEQAFGGEFT